jgi:AcrR family transcriptional regulator
VVAVVPTSETSEERRARLISVATQLIARDGVAACTFRNLAHEAGCSTRPFTHAFGTRDALLREVALRTWDDAEFDYDTLDDPTALPASWDCAEALVEIGLDFLPHSPALRESERIYIEIVLYSLTRPELGEELLTFSRAANQRVIQLLDEGKRRGQVTAEQSSADLVMAFWSFQEGIALTALYESSELPMERVAPIWRAGVKALLRP